MVGAQINDPWGDMAVVDDGSSLPCLSAWRGLAWRAKQRPHYRQ